MSLFKLGVFDFLRKPGIVVSQTFFRISYTSGTAFITVLVFKCSLMLRSLPGFSRIISLRQAIMTTKRIVY